MIDAHCHLEFMDPGVVEDARKFGMKAVVTSIADQKHNAKVMKLRAANPNFVYVCMGLHPAEVEYDEADVESQMETIRDNLNNIVAVGEVGLDYHHVRDGGKREETKEIFKRFIDLANEVKKPMVIHSRDAMPDTLELLKAAKVPVMMHFFTGSARQMKEALNRGYCISFTTITVRNKQLRRLAKACPLDQMLLETDAPWLDPDPNAPRGPPEKLTNRPWNVALTAEKIAKEKGISKGEVLSATAENASRLFGFDLE